MTIQITVNDGIKTKTETYRNVFRGVNLSEYREYFFEHEQWCKWGTMVQLKGVKRLVLGRFGNDDAN